MYTLWHIPFSHYSEKARWALDYKGVRYDRRVAPAGTHMAVALWLTRGRRKTFPLLVLDGKPICDSTAIIAALERRFPEPPLYPSDPRGRARALELEDFFDEDVAEYVRRLVFHEITHDRAALERFVLRATPERLRFGFTGKATAGFLHARFGTHSEKAAETSREKIRAGLARLEAELGAGEYLVGDRFTVADLTAASIFYPLVLPPEGPDFEVADAFLRFRDSLGRSRGLDWVKEMFRRHRAPEPTRATAGDHGTLLVA